MVGHVADYFYDKDVFKHWNIQTNRVDFRDDASEMKKFGAFIGFRNAGYLTFNPDTKNLFVDKSISFWKHALDNPHFKIPEITRFGYRAKVFVKSDREFDDVRHRLISHTLSDELRKLAGGELRDLSITLDIKDTDFSSRFQVGPVKKKEARQYFNFDSEEFKSAGVFVDLDIYSTDSITAKGVPELIKKANERLWTKVDSLCIALDL